MHNSCGCRIFLRFLHTHFYTCSYLRLDMASETNKPEIQPEDGDAAGRKRDHIELAFKSRVEAGDLDARFYYEPMLAPHPYPGSLPPQLFQGKTLQAPIWVSSMTGGTAQAGQINRRLAKACARFGMGMGLGSCRQLLYSQTYFSDFDLRDIIGDGLPFYANLGLAQIEQLIEQDAVDRIGELLQALRADGLIVHINPLQEAMQPEGDVFKHSPLETIQELTERLPISLIVKEVGQGFGPASIKALLQLPLDAVEFAAAGGTNFAKLELLRSSEERQMTFGVLSKVGHSAYQMLEWTNQAVAELGERCRTRQLILSGGVVDFLDGYYLTQCAALPAVYGQASALLRYAQYSEEALEIFIQSQIRGLELAHAFLRVRV